MKKQSKNDKIRNERKKYSEEFWKPDTENSKFDENFPIDRTYVIEYPEQLTKQEKCRIRFVKHPDCGEDEIRIYRISIIVSLPVGRWIGGGYSSKDEERKEFRAAKVIESSEKIMKIKDAEDKYGIKLQ
jgi:hypothetical protein